MSCCSLVVTNTKVRKRRRSSAAQLDGGAAAATHAALASAAESCCFAALALAMSTQGWPERALFTLKESRRQLWAMNTSTSTCETRLDVGASTALEPRASWPYVMTAAQQG